MASISHDDTNAVVIIGSGAGGGTLAHELTRRGSKVVLLEAGARQSLASFSQVPGEAFAQLTWLEPRTQSGTTTVVVMDRQDGGRNDRALDGHGAARQ